MSGGAVDASLNYAINSLVLSQWDRAIEVLEDLLERYPNHVDAMGHLAYARLGAGQYGAARAVARRYLSLEPDAIEGRVIMAQTYAMERDISQALLWLKLVHQEVRPAEFRALVKQPAFKRIQEHPEFQALLR
jgi:tetratricopeptide (TPR) repeat protein